MRGRTASLDRKIASERPHHHPISGESDDRGPSRRPRNGGRFSRPLDFSGHSFAPSLPKSSYRADLTGPATALAARKGRSNRLQRPNLLELLQQFRITILQKRRSEGVCLLLVNNW